ARDAMPNGGTLSVGLQSSGRSELPEKLRDRLPDKRFACLSVSDTGLGMDQKTIEKIFDPFFTTKPQGKGTGLGLSIVYGLVQEMGGGVHVDSCRGDGTTFRVYLPLSEAPVSKALSRHDGDPSSIKLKGYTILVAEDEPDLLQIVCEMLEQMEATVIPASNGNDALVRQDEYEGDIDILLTDVVMPELNGVKLASLLTSLRPSTKVVFMSGYPGRGDMAPIEVPENVIFIPKPIDYAVLASTLHDLLQGEKPDMLSGSPEQVPSHWVSHSGKIH
ncbi:MAG: response regulator, partial [Alphaproteobacteria bacterium]|nr:response regulator [Alphaproteobacteria bacterium]